MENVCDLRMKADKQRHGPLHPAQKPSEEEEEEEFLRRQTGKKAATTQHCVTVLRRQVTVVEAFLVVHFRNHLTPSEPAVVECLDGSVHLGHL